MRDILIDSQLSEEDWKAVFKALKRCLTLLPLAREFRDNGNVAVLGGDIKSIQDSTGDCRMGNLNAKLRNLSIALRPVGGPGRNWVKLKYRFCHLE